MKIVITGLPQAGQQQLFSLLTGIALEKIIQKPLEVQQGVSVVGDPRLERLAEMYQPKKVTAIQLEYVLLPDFNLQGPAKDTILSQLKNAEEICWVMQMESAKQDVAAFISELIIFDLMLVEKRLQTIAKEKQKRDASQKEKEIRLLEVCKQRLEEEKPLQGMEMDEEQFLSLRNYQFLTLKPLILVVNAPEQKIGDTVVLSKITSCYSFPAFQVSAALEEEISHLEEKDRASFMQEMGIAESALQKMTRAAFSGLGYISFFSVGEDEVRAWPLRKGALAVKAGGVIHSDIEKGFVRAELMKYEELMAAGSEQRLKETGKLYLKGRDYVVEDGDIMNFRFNV